jgi:hypothetical protein
VTGRLPNPALFIVGCPRSGTTLLQRLVDAHPDIAVIPELEWIPRAGDGYVEPAPEDPVPAELLRRLAARGRFGKYTPLPFAPGELEPFASGERSVGWRELMTRFYDGWAVARGKPLVANKTVDHVPRIAFLHRMWPSARFVHLIRDGRDVVLSALAWRRAEKLAARFSTWREHPVATAALWWEWQVRLGREAGAALAPRSYGELRYEALAADPETAARRVCELAGVPYADRMLRFWEGRAPATDGRATAKHRWLPPTPGLRDWRTEMAPDDVARFEAVAGDLLDELGYARGAPPARGDARAEAARLRARFEGRPLPARWPRPPQVAAQASGRTGAGSAGRRVPPQASHRS